MPTLPYPISAKITKSFIDIFEWDYFVSEECECWVIIEVSVGDKTKLFTLFKVGNVFYGDRDFWRFCMVEIDWLGCELLEVGLGNFGIQSFET